jgi:uncharacterized protein (TIGR02145 family)
MVTLQKFIIVQILVLSINSALIGQIAINTEGNPADSSAILDISSTNKGILIPRIDYNDRLASPATGLMIYVTSNGPYGNSEYYYYDGSYWKTFFPIKFEGIGDSIMGGILFWVDSTQQHGLIAAPSDSWFGGGLFYQWGCSGLLIPGLLYGFGSGDENTAAIVAYCDQEHIAARGCSDLVLNGYDDWFLPSRRELCEMSAYYELIGGFTPSYYWSSTSYSADYALPGPIEGYCSDGTSTVSKNIQYRVRCIRKTDGCGSVPSEAIAGPDQINFHGISTSLQAVSPLEGSGLWTILSGIGGSIVNREDPASGFSGVAGNSYSLRWAVYNPCGMNTDTVTVSFDCPMANAGPDQVSLENLSASLQGNTPGYGTGFWSIVSGAGGNISNPSDPSTTFIGIEGNSYLLEWALSNYCLINQRDTVLISFACPTANAGPDQLNLSGTSTSLAGNTPWAGAGQWTITGGSGGSITNPSDPLSLFTGTPGVTYILRWTVTSNCTTVYDEAHISFACSPQPSQANAGPDQSNIAGVTTTLQGNTPVYGTGTWSIISGANGIIAQPNNPSTTFTGTNGTTYILLWTISNSCGSTNDNVSISFAAFSCGNTFQDTRDGHVYTTLNRGSQCWMKQNLDYATGSSVCYAGNPTNCDNYGRLYDWNTASTACPTGWHLPTDAQWCTLLQGIDGTVSCGATGITGTDAGGKMKETGTTYWQAPNTGATNSSGFSARGGGTTTIPGHNLNQWVSFWTATANGANYWSWEMTYNDARVWHTYYGWSNTMSVRCLKN